MKKKDIIELDIKERISMDKSMGFYDDKKVIVKGGLPGQTAEVFVKKVRKNRAEGNINSIIKKADYEIEPICDKFNICGGCSFQNITYEKQLEFKEEYIKGLFDKAGIEYKEFLPILSSPKDTEYRNKMEFSFGDMEKDGPLCLGMHEKGKHHNIVSTDNCHIVDGDYRSILSKTLEYFTHKKIKHYNKFSKEGTLRHLVIRKAMYTGQILVNLVTTSQEKINIEEYKDLLLELNLDGEIVGILHTINDSFSDAVIADEVKIIYGRDYIMEKCLGLDFKISAFSFFQTNTLGSEVLYSVVKDFIGEEKSDVILDLYCGTGTITQILSDKANEVYGIEIVEEAIEAAKINAELNNIDNCRFICGDVLEEVDKIDVKSDLIILDPPRAGIHPKAIDKIISFKPKKFVYVSCKATSLIRDLPFFIEAGYEVDKVRAVDMFPQTGHVETVVLLSHKKPDGHINVKVEFGEGEGKVPLDNIAKRAEEYKPKERVTYKMIKEYIEAKYGFKVHTAYIAEVKRDLGLPMYDAPNAVEELKQSRKHPTAEKVEAIKDALKHFEVI